MFVHACVISIYDAWGVKGDWLHLIRYNFVPLQATVLHLILVGVLLYNSDLTNLYIPHTEAG